MIDERRETVEKKPDVQFDRVLTRVDVLFLAFGAMIGWGWVVLSGEWIIGAGSVGAIIAFLIGGLLVMFVGLTYAELSSAMPKAGGEHSFVLRALGHNASFIAAWAIALGYISVAAFEAVALPTVIEYVFPNFKFGYMWTITGWDVYASWVLIGVIGSIFITAINYRGIKGAALIQTILTVVIFIVGIMLIGGSAVSGEKELLQPLFKDGFGGLLTVMLMTPFMFVGFNVIPQTAEEMNIPYKSIGRILVFSVFLSVLFYIGIIFGVSYVLPLSIISSSSLPTADAMGAAFGSSIFAKVLIFGGLAGILTSWNAFIIGGSRVLYAMAKSKILPSWFAKIHPKYKTPANAIIFIGILTTFAPLLGRPMLVWLVDAGGLTITLAYCMVALSFIVLRKKEPNMIRPFKAGRLPIVGWISFILTIGFVILYMPGMPSQLVWPYEWMIFLGWWLIGAIFIVRMNRAENREHLKEYLNEMIDSLKSGKIDA
ncbi:amino acid permease [Bacillus aquiflavi]|uniref:Amino acid permease n=1 Tax=Bacillus aquiflavi TaxID=2672567 RepID=A0A6B3VXS4_9BACI|nr:amino acid permease [Bacillus aquiflavi]NEY80533.1 amino acid permease [Bacillus aquiflavi]